MHVGTAQGIANVMPHVGIKEIEVLARYTKKIYFCNIKSINYENSIIKN